MEGELWKQLYRMVLGLARGTRPRGSRFTDSQIVLTLLWAVLHERPISWACQRRNWPIWSRRIARPTSATMSRRLRTVTVQQLLVQVEGQIRQLQRPSVYRWIDAKPLPIGGSSQDRQAGFGRAAGCMAKGYKLYAIADPNQGFVAWQIRPMQQKESRVAQELVSALSNEGYLVGDSAYDSTPLYEAAATRSIQLIAPRHCRRSGGLGHRRQSPARLRAMQLLQEPMGRELLKSRDGIERMFGHLTNIGPGLKPLPNWVRGLARVELWVRGKMILYHLWRANQHGEVA